MRVSDPNGEFTAALATYASRIRLEEVPAAVQERAKYAVLDGLGCGMFGSRLPWSEIASRTMVALGKGPTTVWGTDLKLSSDHAALLNGSFIQAFEIDDYHLESGLHACANVLPAALASLDLAPSVTGADLLAAIIAGFEVGARVGQCLNPVQINGRGWHTGSVFGTFAAAAASGRVLRLDSEQMTRAFGIAGTQSSGLLAQVGYMAKCMHHGRSSQSGVYAAVLARNGYTSTPRIFEQGHGGFCTTFTAKKDGFDLSRLTDELGQRFETERISFKRYACNGNIHPAIDALMTIRRRHPFVTNEVGAVIVYCPRATFERVGWPYVPSSLTMAQMNMPFAIAVVLEHDDAFVDQYTEKSIRDQRLIALTRLVTIVHDPALDSLDRRNRHRSRVLVEFHNGNSEQETVDFATGSPANPLSNQQIAAKYERLASRVLGPRRTTELERTVLGMDELANASEVGRLLASGRQRGSTLRRAGVSDRKSRTH